MVKKADVQAQLDPWPVDSRIEGDRCRLEGAVASKSFTLRFTGAAGVASRQAGKAFAGLRGKDGRVLFHAHSAEGTGPLRLNLGADKNCKHIKTEVQVKKAS